MVEENGTPYLCSTIRVFLHQGAVAFDPSPNVPQQQDPADHWRVPEGISPGIYVSPGNYRVKQAFDQLAACVRVGPAK